MVIVTHHALLGFSLANSGVNKTRLSTSGVPYYKTVEYKSSVLAALAQNIASLDHNRQNDVLHLTAHIASID